MPTAWKVVTKEGLTSSDGPAPRQNYNVAGVEVTAYRTDVGIWAWDNINSAYQMAVGPAPTPRQPAAVRARNWPLKVVELEYRDDELVQRRVNGAIRLSSFRIVKAAEFPPPEITPERATALLVSYMADVVYDRTNPHGGIVDPAA